MNRETINISDLPYWQMIATEDSIEGFEYIQEEQTDFDTEKAFATFEIIVRRLSDGKYFKVDHSRWGAGGRQTNPIITEVFPKQITTTIYE